MADRTERFWNRMAKRYSRQPIADEASYQHKLQITQKHFRPNMEVLEIGCGTGSTAIIHAPRVKHIRAVDVSSKMLEIAKRKVAEANIKNITFEHSAIGDLRAGEQTLDVVLALSVLHLLEDKEDAARRVHGWLKPGGLFVTSTVCLGDTMKFFKVLGPIGKALGLMPLVKVFTKQELLDSLVRAGFAVDYEWQPSKGKAVFVVARKPD